MELKSVSRKKPVVSMTAAMVRRILRNKYAPPAFAVFEELRNRTGYAGRERERYLDMLVMSLYPSDGLELTGLEIKVSRADFKKELLDPDKSDAFSRYVDRWYIAAPAELLPVEELPLNWGLMEVSAAGQLRKVKEAPKLNAAPLDRSFVAAMIRNVADTSRDSIAEKIRDSVDERLKREMERWRAEEDTLRRERDTMRNAARALARLMDMYEGHLPEDIQSYPRFKALADIADLDRALEARRQTAKQISFAITSWAETAAASLREVNQQLERPDGKDSTD